MVVEQLKTEGYNFLDYLENMKITNIIKTPTKYFQNQLNPTRKQVEQEFANGKGDGKKLKKFYFQGEMKK